MSTLSPALMSSTTDDWPTPRDLVNALASRFGAFTLDPCATAENAKARRFFTRHDDGLRQSWAGETVWMNPPYGREIGRWVAKAYRESLNENTRVVCLIPARTDTRYWHEFAMRATEILLIRGRITFGDAITPAPFPSAVVYFDGSDDPPRFSSWTHAAAIQEAFDFEETR